ncbi:glycosyltransferase [Rhodoligotrophos appendicifer]|uniref:glycosyltransferase n=1 Tax=Rhodoligotrophos appendicifer TaxID=987056 RepID=UPI0011865F6C|nr:glycosyltransferase [Rhodoligotrophos appendicifer]
MHGLASQPVAIGLPVAVPPPDNLEGGPHPGRVLHCITDLDIGGAECMLTQLLTSGSSAVRDSTVLSLMKPGRLKAAITQAGISVHSLDVPRGRLQLGKLAPLTRLIQRTHPRLIHGWMYHGNVAGTLGAMVGSCSAPVIWSIHHSLYDLRTEKSLTRRTVQLSALLSSRTSAIVYCSRVAAKQHEAAGFDPARSVIIYNGVDCSNFRPDWEAKGRLAQSLNIPPERMIIGSVGRCHPMKSQCDLVRSLAILLKQGYDVHGLFVGPGQPNGAAMKMACSIGLESRVSFRGEDAIIADIMPGLDIHAISSTWGEAFSCATAEAMASGVASVVTNIGDCPHVVGLTGIITSPGQPEALASALASLLDLSNDDRRQLGLKARERVVDNFSLAQYINQHTALYKRIFQDELSTKHR